MKKIMIKLLKIFLALTVVVLILFLIWGAVVMAGWPWWVSIFILVGFIGLGIGIVFLKKLMARKSEQKFVHQVIAQEESRYSTMNSGEKSDAKELQGRWKEAVDALRGSHLKKYGNPLYVLPWYMVIGESGSGKTTAIKGAELSSPFAEVTRASGISGTKNCDWWFFEQAVIIDTAGRYAIPVDQGRDKDEWQQFLSLLAKFRKKEPLNGLVVTVAADKLIQSDARSLEESGKSIRKRVDELMRVLGAKFPIYIMVTKCDLIQGAVKFCDKLDEKTQQQAMGGINHDLSQDVTGFNDRLISNMGERLKDLRLIMLNDDGDTSDPSLLLFPEEFEKLRNGLNAFIHAAFMENPYQETPLLRGIHFSSGRQEGTPFSHFLNKLGLIGKSEVLPGTNKGLFLHDFFSKILPGDRGLFRPTQKTMEWSRLTKNLGLTSWVAVAIAVCGLLSFSFVKNLTTLKDVSNEFSSPPVLQGNFTPDVLTLERFRKAVIKVEEENSNWWIPRLGLSESKDVEQGLKKKYCQLFEAGILKSFDKTSSEVMTGFSTGTSNFEFANHATHMARRINLIKAVINKDDLEHVGTMPQPAYNQQLIANRSDIIDEISSKISNQYLYYLFWRNDQILLNNELKNLQTWLKHILTMKGTTINWLVDMVDRNPDITGARLEHFWAGVEARDDHVYVPASFTTGGKKAVEALLQEVENALFDPLSIAGKKLEFWKWYDMEYSRGWRAFAEYFPKGANALKGRDNWARIASEMQTDKGPYFAFLDRMAKEFSIIKESPNAPVWTDLVFEFKTTRAQAKTVAKKGIKKAGIIKSATARVKSKMAGVERATGVDAAKGINFETRMKAAGALAEFRKALNAMSGMSDSSKTAFKMATNLFLEDAAEDDTPFLIARKEYKTLRSSLSYSGKEANAFWDLVKGPLDFYSIFAAKEASCRLQSMWEKDVYLEVQDVPGKTNLNKLVMGQGGYGVKFIKGPAKPFINRSRKKGYHAKRVDGRSLDFEDRFFKFLNKGAKALRPAQSSYSVVIKAHPTDANKGASIKPHSTNLEVKCADKKMKLLNLHYPVRKTFNWSPQNCGDVIFQINIGSLVLTKIYSGYQGFAKFLDDFKTGQRTFYPNDFPNEAAALKRMRIKYIKAKYQFSGHRPVLRYLHSAPGSVPQEIVTCWEG